MKKSKGFTLIELLAVVSLIALLSLVVVPTVMNLVTTNQTKLDKTTEQLIFSAVDMYLDYNQMEYIKGDGAHYCITIKELQDKDFLEKGFIDTKTGEPINENYVVESIYTKDLWKNKYEYKILTEQDDIDECNNNYYKPALSGIAIGNLSYYRCVDEDNNNICDNETITDDEKRDRVYANVDDMYIIVPIEAPNLSEGTELTLKIREGKTYVNDFTPMTTTVNSEHQAEFRVRVTTGMGIGEYVIESSYKDKNEKIHKATKNLRIYQNPIILFMGD